MDKLREEKGAVTIVVTAALVSLLLSLAVVIDMGLLYQERRQLQTCTDAAALAAAMDLAEGQSVTDAVSRAVEYVSVNANVEPSRVEIDFPQSKQVRVIAETSRNVFLSGIIGWNSAKVAAKSTATMGATSGVAKLAPFIVPLHKVSLHTGEANVGSFELGEDRPLDPFSKVQEVSGDNITYIITHSNTGNKTEDITVMDYIPDGAVYINDSVNNGGVYYPSSKKLEWNFQNVGPDDYRTMAFSVKMTSGTVSTISNTAYLTTSGSGKTTTADCGANAQRGYFWLCNFDGDGGGVPDYDRWIRNGYPDYVYVGDIANGVGMKASLRDALDWRKGFNPSIIVPVYSYTSGGGSPGAYHVVGFAEFVVTDFNFCGQPKTIRGYFTDGTVAKGVPGPAPEAYFGIDTIWLVD